MNLWFYIYRFQGFFLWTLQVFSTMYSKLPGAILYKHNWHITYCFRLHSIALSILNSGKLMNPSAFSSYWMRKKKDHRIKEERNEQQLLGFYTKNKGNTEGILHILFLWWNGFDSSHNVHNLKEVTQLKIPQRSPLVLKITGNLWAPNTAPKQRRALGLPSTNVHFTALCWVSLCSLSCHTLCPAVPWGASLARSPLIKWGGNRTFLSLFASFEAIQQEKKGDSTRQTFERYWEGHRELWLGQPESLGDTARHGKCQTPKTSSSPTPWTSGAAKPTKTEGNYAAKLILWKEMGEVEGKIRKQSRLGSSARLWDAAHTWKSSTEPFWASPLCYSPHIYADCTIIGPLVFRKISPRTAFYTWGTANSRWIQQKARGASI